MCPFHIPNIFSLKFQMFTKCSLATGFCFLCNLKKWRKVQMTEERVDKVEPADNN